MADANDGTMTNIPEADAPRTELPKIKGNRILDWLLVRRELAQAEANAATFTTEQREFLRRAQLALELGELAFAPGNVVRAGSTAPLAANLFRQAVYWALLVQRPQGGPVSPEQLWAESDRSLVQTVAGNEGELAYLTSAMRSTFIELADGTEEAQRADAVTLRRAAKRLVSSAQRVLWRAGMGETEAHHSRRVGGPGAGAGSHFAVARKARFGQGRNLVRELLQRAVSPRKVGVWRRQDRHLVSYEPGARSVVRIRFRHAGRLLFARDSQPQ